MFFLAELANHPVLDISDWAIPREINRIRRGASDQQKVLSKLHMKAADRREKETQA